MVLFRIIRLVIDLKNFLLQDFTLHAMGSYCSFTVLNIQKHLALVVDYFHFKLGRFVINRSFLALNPSHTWFQRLLLRFSLKRLRRSNLVQPHIPRLRMHVLLDGLSLRCFRIREPLLVRWKLLVRYLSFHLRLCLIHLLKRLRVNHQVCYIAVSFNLLVFYESAPTSYISWVRKLSSDSRLL